MQMRKEMHMHTHEYRNSARRIAEGIKAKRAERQELLRRNVAFFGDIFLIIFMAACVLWIGFVALELARDTACLTK